MTLRRWLLALVFASALCAAETPPEEPLFQALQKSNATAVKRLLDSGADPNARDADGTPSLMAAVLYAGADCVKLLLDRGADPNAANKVGANALMWAVPDLAKSRLLIAAGANVDARARNTQRTPLLVAASYPRSVPVLQLLLDHGADIHAKDRLGVHALGRATLSADVDVVRFLVEHGCDLNEPGYGTTVRYPVRLASDVTSSSGTNDATRGAREWEDHLRDLMVRYQQGEAAAVETLVTNLSPTLLRFCSDQECRAATPRTCCRIAGCVSIARGIPTYLRSRCSPGSSRSPGMRAWTLIAAGSGWDHGKCWSRGFPNLQARSRRRAAASWIW